MKIKHVWAVYYSATGNTEKIAKHIAETISAKLGVPFREFNFTLPETRKEKKVFGEGDLVVFGTPVYAGRIPNKILPYVQEGFQGNGAMAVPVVSFGNRSFDDALMELRNELEDHGFHTVAGAAVTSIHAFAGKLAPGRPDASDMEELYHFAAQIEDKLKKMNQMPNPVEVPGRNPVGAYYKPLGIDGNPAVFLKAKPKTNTELCNQCGVCAKVCPMGSVSTEDYSVVNGICIKCQACIKYCAEGAKYFDDEAFLSHKAMLEQNYQRRVENQFFFAE